MYIKNKACCRCGMTLPMNYLTFRAASDDKLIGEWPICANCSGMWNKEAVNHFKEWIKEGVTDGKKK